jgi:hypothetical protein
MLIHYFKYCTLVLLMAQGPIMAVNKLDVFEESTISPQGMKPSPRIKKNEEWGIIIPHS